MLAPYLSKALVPLGCMIIVKVWHESLLLRPPAKGNTPDYLKV